MGSSGKRRTTPAKLNREAKLRDKRVEKRARKEARRLSAAADAQSAPTGAEEPVIPPGQVDGDWLDGPEEEPLAAISEPGGPGR